MGWLRIGFREEETSPFQYSVAKGGKDDCSASGCLSGATLKPRPARRDFGSTTISLLRHLDKDPWIYNRAWTKKGLHSTQKIRKRTRNEDDHSICTRPLMLERTRRDTTSLYRLCDTRRELAGEAIYPSVTFNEKLFLYSSRDPKRPPVKYWHYRTTHVGFGRREPLRLILQPLCNSRALDDTELVLWRRARQVYVQYSK